MNGEHNDQECVHSDRKSLVGQVALLLECRHHDVSDAEEVEDKTMVDRANSAFERAESEEFLSAPDLVDAVRVFDLFLLNCLLMELG